MSHSESVFFKNSQTALCSEDGSEQWLVPQTRTSGEGAQTSMGHSCSPAGPLHRDTECMLAPRQCLSPSHVQFSCQHRPPQAGWVALQFGAQKWPFGSHPLILSSSFLLYELERQTLTLRARGTFRCSPTCHSSPPKAPSPCTPPVTESSPLKGVPGADIGESSSLQTLASLRTKDSTWGPRTTSPSSLQNGAPARPCFSPIHNFGG